MCPFKKAFPFVLLLHLLVAVGIVGAFATPPQQPKEHIFTLMPVQGQGEVLKAGEAKPRCPLRPEVIKENWHKLMSVISEHAQKASTEPELTKTPQQKFEPTETVAEVSDKPTASIAASTSNPRAFVGGATQEKKVSNKLTAPVVIYQPKPCHAGGRGEVIVTFTITPQGNVEDVQLERGSNPELVRAVRRAVERWKFSPAKRNGEAIELRVRQVVQF